MEPWLKASWIALALVHLPPAAVVVRPPLLQKLYGVPPGGSEALLLVHRGALFLGLVLLSVLAAFDPGARRAGAVAVAVSVLGYLLLYVRAGAAPGPLRTVAWVDAAALVPLAVVLYDAFRRGLSR